LNGAKGRWPIVSQRFCWAWAFALMLGPAANTCQRLPDFVFIQIINNAAVSTVGPIIYHA
jgi:hypothetical protein